VLRCFAVRKNNPVCRRAHSLWANFLRPILRCAVADIVLILRTMNTTILCKLLPGPRYHSVPADGEGATL
jgi:hypothetical protein